MVKTSNNKEMISEDENWDSVVKPKTGLFNVNIKELIQYSDLNFMFIKRNIITQYKQTILGPLWFFINPTITTIMYMIVFGGIAKISTDGLPQPLFYLSGICLWNYFSSCLTRTSSTFIENEYIFGKVYFPRLIMPISTVTSNFITLGIQLLLFIAVYVYYIIVGVQISPNIYLLLVPVLFLMLAGLALGFGILISSMTTKYRDLNILLGFVMQLWMYATPIIYPLSVMPANKQWIAALNPITSIMEAFKYATLGQGTINWTHLGYSFGFMCVLLFVGILIFNKVQRSFMDTV